MQSRAFLTRLALVLASSTAILLPVASAESAGPANRQAPREIRVDYGHHSPASLAVRHFGWLEEEFKPDGTEIRWVRSQGSRRALELLAADAVDFGSATGPAAVLSRADGNPIKTVYVYASPDWTVLELSNHSLIQSADDLQGRRVDYSASGFLNARERFVAQSPQATARVIKVYERARRWIEAYPSDAAKLVAVDAKVSLSVAKHSLARMDFSQSALAAAHANALKLAAPILLDEGLLRPGTDVARVIDDLFSPAISERVVAAQIR